MPFSTQGRTNLKYILIIVLLAAIVGGGILIWQYLLTPREELLPGMKLPEEETTQPKFTFLNKTLLFARDYADPSVIQLDNGAYLMYLNHRDEEGRSGSLILSSPDGLSWKQETDIVFPGVAVGRAFKFPNGVHYYYHQPERKPSYPFEPVPLNIVSSFSSNSLTGWKDEGIRLKAREGYAVTGPTLVKLKDGRYRMFFDEVKLAKPGEQRIIEGIIYGASSTDGLTWVRDNEPIIVYENNVEGEGLFGPQPPQVLHPFAMEWPEANGYLMLYNSHSRIFAAFSNDGFSWKKLGYTGIWGADVDAIRLPDGTFRIYYGGGCPKDTQELACIDPETREYITVPSTIHTGILKIETGKEKSIQQPTLPPSTGEEPEQVKEGQSIEYEFPPAVPFTDTSKDGPWNRDLWITESSDGSTFGTAKVFIERAGVPSITKDLKGRLIIAFQWFPENNKEHFDQVALVFSEDDGKTWSQPKPMKIADFPQGYMRPFDPTVITIPSGKIRMYFTSKPQGPGQPSIFSAISDDSINYIFEQGERFGVGNEMVIDSAVGRIGNTWHLLSPINIKGVRGSAYHAVSGDGLNFSRKQNIQFQKEINWIGNLLQFDEGLRFYGSGFKIWWTFTQNGDQWTEPQDTNVIGGDPAVLKLPNLNYLMIYVGQPKSPLPSGPLP